MGALISFTAQFGCLYGSGGIIRYVNSPSTTLRLLTRSIASDKEGKLLILDYEKLLPQTF